MQNDGSAVYHIGGAVDVILVAQLAPYYSRLEGRHAKMKTNIEKVKQLIGKRMPSELIDFDDTDLVDKT